MTAEARRGLFALYRRQGTRAWIEATGTSMRPLVRSGTQLLVHFGEQPRRRGDIVLLAREDWFVAHRVVSLRPLTTKGDGERRFDPLPHAADVLGVAHALRLPTGHVTRLGCAGPTARALAWASLVAGWLYARVSRPGRTSSRAGTGRPTTLV